MCYSHTVLNLVCKRQHLKLTRTMGNFPTTMMNMFWLQWASFFTTEARVLMVGLDAAGKTTALYKLKLGEVVTTIPTIGFNVESVEYKNINFTVWDIGGQSKIRALWRYYYANSNCIIFVIDSSDRDRAELAREELHKLLHEDELRDSVILVLANKQDLPDAMTAAELADKLDLHSVRSHQWYIQSTCATTGAGLHEGLDWIGKAVSEQQRSIGK